MRPFALRSASMLLPAAFARAASRLRCSFSLVPALEEVISADHLGVVAIADLDPGRITFRDQVAALPVLGDNAF